MEEQLNFDHPKDLKMTMDFVVVETVKEEEWIWAAELTGKNLEQEVMVEEKLE